MQNNSKPLWITPDWPMPDGVKALTTLREGGVSLGEYSSFNLADHVGDKAEAVLQNRDKLQKLANLPTEPFWLKQVHGTTVVEVPSPALRAPSADASIAFSPNQICAVLTADCLPILLTNIAGTCVAAVHAGWRGLAAGVIEQTVHKLNKPPESLIAWLGPAIGPDVFEVGEEVKSAFDKPGDEQAFQKGVKPNKWLADLYKLARLRLNKIGVLKVYGGGFCTFTEDTRFYSYRRSPQTGRMATLIWITSS